MIDAHADVSKRAAAAQAEKDDVSAAIKALSDQIQTTKERMVAELDALVTGLAAVDAMVQGITVPGTPVYS